MLVNLPRFIPAVSALFLSWMLAVAPFGYAQELLEEYEEDGDLSAGPAAQDSSGRPTGNTVKSGEIILEDYDNKKVDTYSVNQEEAIRYFKSFEAAIPQIGSGASVNMPKLSDGALLYLTGAYLYCSVNNGVCPFILDAILESDIVASAASGTSGCPSMTQFWKIWLANDMEQRHKYLVKTGHLHTTSDFRAKVRPKYLKCKETVAAELAKGPLSKRYQSEGNAARAITTTAQYLAGLPEAVPNVFVATGAQGGAAQPQPDRPAKK